MYYKKTSAAFDGDYKERLKTYNKKVDKYPYAYEDFRQAQTVFEYELLENFWTARASIVSHITMIADTFATERKLKSAVRYWKEAKEVSTALIDQISKKFQHRYPDDPLCAIPPYYFEQLARNLMKLAENQENKQTKTSRYLEAWENYENYLKYAKHHRDPFFTSEIEKQITELIKNFEKNIGKERRAKNRSKVWKKSI